MFHPVGSRPPAVYWRRRFVLLASIIAVLALLAITVKVLASDGSGGQPAAGGTPGTASTTTPKPRTSAPRTRSSTSRQTKPAQPGGSSKPPSSSGSSPDGPQSSSSTAASAPCTPANLGLAAATNKKQYSVGEQLTLSIRVTNKGKTDCVVDLGDPQVLLKVYNGESRVWGSHDCEVTPGKVERTLMAGQAVRVSIVWSGLSARPNCAGARQRVGAGSYTLVAYLSGHKGSAAQFAIK